MTDAGPGIPLSLAVGRGLGTVTVTVHGPIDAAGCVVLGGVLTDLIEGQGNRTVTVDLRRAVVASDTLGALRHAVHADDRSGRCIVRTPHPNW